MEVLNPDAHKEMKQKKPRADFNPEKHMAAVRKRFQWLFQLVVISSLVLIAATCVVMYVIAFTSSNAAERGLIFKLIQVSFGMILGSACVFFGVLVSWLGVTASYTFGGNVGENKLNLQSTSPALALIFGGIILIGVSLYRNIKYKETEYPGGTVIRQKQGSGPDPN